MQDKKNTRLIVGIIVIAVLFFVGLVWLVMRLPTDPSSSNVGKPEQVTFNDQNSQSMGPVDAKVVVHLYSDFQCPACQYAEAAVKATIDNYKDRVRFVWKDFPLEQIHPNARIASNAARCAVDQGKFWEYHDMLYVKQTQWDDIKDPRQLFIGEAGAMGMNEGTFTSCLNAKSHDGLISQDQNEGLDNNVDRTPTFFINNKRYFTMSQADWSKNLDQALLEAGASTTQN